MQVRLQCAIKIVIFQLQLKKEIEKREIRGCLGYPPPPARGPHIQPSALASPKILN